MDYKRSALPTFKEQVMDPEEQEAATNGLDQSRSVENNDGQDVERPEENGNEENGSVLLFQGFFSPNGNNSDEMSDEKRAMRAVAYKDQVVVAGHPLHGRTRTDNCTRQGGEATEVYHKSKDKQQPEFVADSTVDKGIPSVRSDDPENEAQDGVRVGLAVLIGEEEGEMGSQGFFPVAEVEKINPFFQKKFVLALAGVGLLGISLAVALPLTLIEQPDPITPSPTMAPTSASIGNGFCDAEFNIVDFSWDGGDCCEQTCEASIPFASCGKGDDGLTYVGYDSCLAVEPSEAKGQRAPNAFPIDGTETFAAQFGASLAISPNGQVLLVGEDGSDAARLFDKDGSMWRQRGEALEGPPGSDFGRSVVMAVDSITSSRVSNRALRVPVTIAVGGPAHDEDGGIVRVYDCLTDGCVQAGPDLVGSGGFVPIFSDQLGRSLDLSNDGRLLAVVARGGDVQVYERSDINDDYILRDTLSAPRFTPSTYISLYVTLSGDGNTLAVAYLNSRIPDAPEPFNAVLTTSVFKYAGGGN